MKKRPARKLVSRALSRKVQRIPWAESLDNLVRPAKKAVGSAGFQAVPVCSAMTITKAKPTRAVVGISQRSDFGNVIACTRQNNARPATQISGRIDAQSALRGARALKATSMLASEEIIGRKGQGWWP